MSLGKGPRKNGLRKMVPEKWSSGKKIRGEMVPWKRYPEKWSSGKKIRGKMVPWKTSPEKWSSWKKSAEKWSPEKYPKKIVLRQKNARKFGWLLKICIYLFHYTNKNMIDVLLIILHAPNCRTLNKSRKVCCWVLDFYRLITFQHSTHTTILDAHPTIFCFRILGFHRLITDPQTTGACINTVKF